MNMITLINLITISRILLAAVIFVLLTLNEGYLAALILFLIASITDYLDGYLARKYNAVSALGEILDPIADKILILFLLIAISINLSSYFIGFFGACIITREIWVGALRDLNARNNNIQATKVSFLAKIKTTFQMFTISLYMLGLVLNNMLIIVFADIFLLISFLLTIYTGYEYTYKTFKS
jgi:CDP-diacylglycerol--glycerol-3-phosphate 3-phosphatidyltransferase